MLQKIVLLIKRLCEFAKRGWKFLWGEETVAPTVPPKTGVPPHPPAVREPELGMGAAVPPEYRLSKSLFTHPESVFFKTLLEDVGGQYVVFAKVRLADVIWLANEPENRKYHSNQLHCKHFDFLLCEKGTYKPLLVVELDDSSHDKYEHYERDEFKNQVCADIGLKMWRPRVQQAYPKGFIAEHVRRLIQSSGK